MSEPVGLETIWGSFFGERRVLKSVRKNKKDISVIYGESFHWDLELQTCIDDFIECMNTLRVAHFPRAPLSTTIICRKADMHSEFSTMRSI